MDNQRTLLFAALAFIAVLIWQAWQKDYVLPQQIQQQVQSEGVNSSADVPNVAKSEPLPTGVNQETEPKDLALNGGVIEVITDVYELKIDKVGGNIVNLYLTQYPDTKGLEETVQLLNNTPSKTFVVESGLIVQNGESPNHHALWSASDSQYVMTGDELRVPLTWKNESGIEVTKTYVFSKGSYKVDVETSIENNGSNSWSAREYLQIKRNDYADKKANSMIYTYTGGVLYTDEDKYQKIDFDDMEDENLSQEATGGWAGMIQHYFGVAWVPEKENNYTYYTKALSAGKYVIGAYSPMTVVEPGQRKTINSVLFAGPKLQEQLKEIAPGLELMVDYGKLTIIAEPIFWLLSFFYDFVGNWGVAIIMVTFTIKALFFKLSEKSYKSMAHMKLVQPRIVALKERYGDDKQQLNKAMAKQYKTEKINQSTGCSANLITIPVFIALYWTFI